MKKDIHPNYHEITVKLTDGSSFTTCSTWGNQGDVLQLDVDPNTHPAWTGGGAIINQKAGRVARFKEKFGNIGQASAANTDEESDKK